MNYRLVSYVLAAVVAALLVAVGFLWGRLSSPPGAGPTAGSEVEGSPGAASRPDPTRNLGGLGGLERMGSGPRGRGPESPGPPAARVSPAAEPPPAPLTREEAIAGLSDPATAVASARTLLALGQERAPTADDARLVLRAAQRAGPEARYAMVLDGLGVLKGTDPEGFWDEAARILGSPDADLKRAALLNLTAGVDEDAALEHLLRALGDPDVADLAHRVLVNTIGRGHDAGRDPAAWRTYRAQWKARYFPADKAVPPPPPPGPR